MSGLKLPENHPPIPAAVKPLVDALLKLIETQRREIRELRAALNAPRRSAAAADPNQGVLGFVEPAAAPAPAPAESERPKEEQGARQGHGRGRLPGTLRREREEHRPPAEQLSCAGCGAELTKIGEEVTEELEYVPASCYVRELVRPKFACVKCQDRVVIAEMPERPILKGRPGAGMLAHVATAKYCDHLPLERLRKIFLRQGLHLSVSTLCDWVGWLANAYGPVQALMCIEALESGLLNSDETPIAVLDPPNRETKTGRLWVHIGGGHVLFDYAPDKSALYLANFLNGYRGLFQGDSSSVNVSFAKGAIRHAGCWAHVRRRFDAARETSPEPAREALAYIRALYDVEDEAKLRMEATAADPSLPPFGFPERALLRQEKSAPLLEKFQQWIEVQVRIALPKSPLGEALHYVRSQWRPLQTYLEDGRLSIDNNVSERNLRVVAVGRKNWTFAGSDAGGRRAAALYSLVQSCKLHGLDPFAYFRDTLPLLSTKPARDLTPKAWAAALAQPATASY